MTLTIRTGKPEEQKLLEALQWRASLANAGDREALLANPDAIVLPLEQIEAGGVFVAELDGVMAGFAAMLPRADGQAELDGLFVEPKQWKNGIGQALVEHCARFAASQGTDILHVIGNPHAGGFYSACGFKVVGTRQTRFGDGLAMEKSLGS